MSLTSSDLDTNSQHDSTATLATTTLDNIENFKHMEETLLQDNPILDHQISDNLSSWIISVESTFEQLKYKGRLYVAFVYDFLDTTLQNWYDQTFSLFKTNWNEFKTCLTSFFIQPPSLTKITPSFKTVAFSSPQNDPQKDDNEKGLCLQQQRVEEIQNILSAIPGFKGDSDEVWFQDLLYKFAELDLEPDTLLYYIKNKLNGPPLIWYYENFFNFVDFSTFVTSFRLKYIDPHSSSSIVQNDTKSSSLINITDQTSENPTNLSTTSIHSFSLNSKNQSVENILQKTLIKDIIKNPKTFSGKDNVSNWLEALEQKFTTAKWPDHLRLEYISQFLTNEAKLWYKERKNHITTWSQFKVEITNAYTSSYEVTLAFQRLKNYQQTNGQFIKQYYADIIKLCKDVDPQMSEQTKLQNLIANLKPSIKINIIEKDPKTTSDIFFKICQNH
ncbi:unnamed protein product [Didymodactylos carnosus]|uniref:Ty3 transposon capsid-like protein domain-containing protein n=1 Tax=Didymodactylos carnosus TaxID=1234261 RepID=A0A815F6Q3_9BILA|nr:unnamed protein product [Didymodactylos carnosus]CAF4167651.1 unnamed protein product [Didymodactylos carnosus]